MSSTKQVYCDICDEVFSIPSQRRATRHAQCAYEYKIQYGRAYGKVQKESIRSGDSQYVPDIKLEFAHKVAWLKARVVAARLRYWSIVDYETEHKTKYNIVDDESIEDDLYDPSVDPQRYKEDKQRALTSGG